MLTPEQVKVLYKEIFNSDSGKKVIDDLGKRFSMNSSTYVPNSDETVYHVVNDMEYHRYFIYSGRFRSIIICHTLGSSDVVLIELIKYPSILVMLLV